MNTRCRPGERSNTFEFVLKNEEASPATYTTAFKGVDCQIDDASFTVNGKAQHSGYISACICPTNVSIEGSIEITSGQYTGELPIKLHGGVLSRVLFDQEYLVKFVIVFFIVAVIGVGIIAASRP
ncbi:MAG: hypothetical protein ABI972_20905 [Acidobacteriota bacterium]